jgi:hypothetical protein
MTDSSPKPSRTVKRRRPSQPTLPWVSVGTLFAVYVLIGLLLSAPMPPFVTWIPAVIGSVLLSWGLISPMAPGQVADRVGILAYVGGLLLVMALAIAANYIGGGEGFNNLSFFVAIFILALLTLLAVVLTGAAAIVNAQAAASLLEMMDYKRSLTYLLSTSFCGALLGGTIGYLMSMLLASPTQAG